MSLFKNVYVFPTSGLPDSPWLEVSDEDSFARSARGVCELYSHELTKEKLTSSRASKLFLIPRASVRESASVTLTITDQGRENGIVELPEGVSDLSAAERAVLAFEVIEAAMRELEESNRWPSSVIQEIGRRCWAQRLHYSWAAPWKMSRDRKHSARGVYRIHPDGYGRTRVEVREESSGRLRSTSAYKAFSTSDGLLRSAKTLRWSSDSTSLTFTPWCGLFGQMLGTRDISLDDLVEGPSFLDPDSDYFELGSSVATSHVEAMRQKRNLPEIVLLGGGPDNGVSDAYISTLLESFEKFRRSWTPWWEEVNVGRLEVIWQIRGDEPKVTLRRGSGKVSARIQRPLGPEIAYGGAPIETARRDIESLARKVSQTFPNPPAPINCTA